MNRVKLTPRKMSTTKTVTISIVGAAALFGVIGLVIFLAGWMGNAGYTAMTSGGDFKGYTPNQAETEKFITSLGKYKSLRTGAPDLFTEALPKEVLLWKAIEEAYRRVYGKEYLIERQTIGDCVSHGTARSASCVFAVDFVNGQRTKWLPVATEYVYAGRAEIGQGSMSDGWYGSAAAKWIKEHGVLFREKYTGPNGSVEDYTVYSGQKAKQQGYRGVPDWLEQKAAAHKVPEVSLITSTGEAKAALANGYAMFICSGVGFEPTVRDANGICRAGGQWSHCMSCLGYYTLTNGETVFVIFNSWGSTGTSGPGGPHGLPGGSFACRERDFARILAARDSFACSGPNGFERRDIDHDTWATISPRGKDHLSRESEFTFAVAP